MKRTNFRLALSLMPVYFKIGAFTFGSGWSILAQFEREFIDKRGLITKDDLLELATVGKSLPGIMITNVTMLMGYRIAGWFGGLTSVVCLTLPAILILTLVTWFYDWVKANVWFGYAMRGIGGAVVAIIAGAALSLGKEALRQKLAILICAAALAVCLFTNVSNVLIIFTGVILGLLWAGVDRQRGKDGRA